MLFVICVTLWLLAAGFSILFCPVRYFIVFGGSCDHLLGKAGADRVAFLHLRHVYCLL